MSISGPIAPWSNAPINAQYYQPSDFFITAISNGPSTTITTSVNHNYIVGQLVRVVIPPAYKEYQLNGQIGYVILIPNPNQMVLNIDSSTYDTFVANPVTTNKTLPQTVAVGDVISGATNSDINSLSTYIPGSFINIS